MKAGRLLLLAAVLVATSACFRQVVSTGRTPGTTVIDRPWTPFFLWGLVAHAPIDVSQQCRTGVATVVTEQTLPNGLVSLITLGIYSPRHVMITCASGTSLRPGLKEFHVGSNASQSERERVFQLAAEEAAQSQQMIIVRF